MQKLLLKVAELCEATGMSRSAAYSAITAGLIPSIRIGKSIRIPLVALNQWIEQQMHQQGAEAEGWRSK